MLAVLETSLFNRSVPPRLGEKCFMPMQTFTVTAAGNYLITVAGGQGGGLQGAPLGIVGGQGATVQAIVFLQSGATIPVIVAGQGSLSGDQFNGGGGGGLSAVYTNGDDALPTIVAGSFSS